MVAVETNSISHFCVRGFAIEGKIPLSTSNLTSLGSEHVRTNVTQKEVANAASELLAPLFSKYTGTNVSEEELVQAASSLQEEYRDRGYPTMIISISLKRISNGIVTMNVFQGVIPQILVSGERYVISDKGVVIAANDLSTLEIAIATGAMNTNAPPSSPNANSTADTNSVPKFAVTSYLITGNTLLSPETLKSIFMKHMGTNIVVGDILNAGLELQKEYRNRGYPTVNVTIPPQKITDGQVKIRVFEGCLSDIIVANNHYFSSNNIMRALPSLHTNVILNSQIFQAELNRANENQDRQIYPTIEPGPVENTTLLQLDVKDRLPLHAKIELNNQSSPGTPDLRINSSAVYNNLWQQDNSLGVQYNFSPETYKSVPPEVSSLNKSEWNFYDQPLVSIYSGFYRLPLGKPEAIEDVVAANPGSFGYNEATRKFNLPPPTGQPELTFYASRATIDTGLTTLSSINLYSTNGNSLFQNTVQQDLTENNDLGFRLTLPLKASMDFHSGLSGGLDFKTYQLTSYKTNIFLLNGQEIDYVAGATNGTSSTNNSPVPVTIRSLEYLPLSLRYDATLNGSFGSANFGLGVNGNAWYSGSISNLQNITGSTKSSGHWVTLNPSFSWIFAIHTNWMTTLRTDGQWASEPLISNEQFGAGGVNSVRGYREGQVFGDTGWHISLEQQTPPHLVGDVYGNIPLTIRGSVYMDFADTYLLDPQGRPSSTALWGTGFGCVGSIGSHWEARFLFSVPLLRTSIVEPYQPFFNFSLTAQF